MALGAALLAVGFGELALQSPWPDFPSVVWWVIVVICLGLVVVGFFTPPERREPAPGPVTVPSQLPKPPSKSEVEQALGELDKLRDSPQVPGTGPKPDVRP
jgi:hypothetical protein